MFEELKFYFRLKRNYFFRFWSWIEFGLIICSWMGVGLYIYRYRECLRISQLFTQPNGYIYINLQYLTYINNYLRFIYGFCCFFGTIKLLRLCRFHIQINRFISTLQISLKELFSFGIMFSFIFLSFICLFYLLFQSKLWSTSTFSQTAVTLFEMILMQFNAYDLINTAPVLGPLVFSLFIFLIIFVCLSVFISIINRSFHQAKEMKYENEEIYLFTWKRFTHWIGVKQTEEEVYEQRDMMMREEYRHIYESLEEKVDQLFDALNRVCFHSFDLSIIK